MHPSIIQQNKSSNSSALLAVLILPFSQLGLQDDNFPPLPTIPLQKSSTSDTDGV